MLWRRARVWLVLFACAAVASCDLNPQPDLPGNSTDAGVPTPGSAGGTTGPSGSGGLSATGGTSADVPTIGEGGADESAGGEAAAPIGGQNAGGDPGDVNGGEGSTPAPRPPK